MRFDYGKDNNTHLIPEYAAYRDRGDALLRHQWNYLASLMPYTLPAHMTYDYFRRQFTYNYSMWSYFATDPNNSILYWVNFDAESHARARLASQSEADRRYNYLSLEDEARLNKVFAEIDRDFTPVDTELTNQRVLQALLDKVRNEGTR